MTAKPPAAMGIAGRELWKRIVGDVQPGWELDERDISNLTAACRAEDRAAELDKLVRDMGLMVAGAAGQERLHPAISESPPTACAGRGAAGQGRDSAARDQDRPSERSATCRASSSRLSDGR